MVDLLHTVDDPGQAVGVVGVLGPVDGGHREVAALQAEVGQHGVGVGELGADLHQDVDHDVTDEDRAGGQALGGQVVHRYLGGGQQQVGGVVGEHAVVLLGHGPVERAQPGLQVRDRQVQLHRGQGAGQGGVGVAVDQHPVGSVLEQDLVHPGQDRARLCAVAGRADLEVHVRVRDPEVGEEDVGEHRVVVLSGVHDDVLHPTLTTGVGHRGQLDELRTGTDHAQDLHGPQGMRWRRRLLDGSLGVLGGRSVRVVTGA